MGHFDDFARWVALQQHTLRREAGQLRSQERAAFFDDGFTVQVELSQRGGNQLPSR